MNVLIRAMDQYFHSLKDETFHSPRLRLIEWNIYLSTHENICTIALTNIHYLYTNPGYSRKVHGMRHISCKWIDRQYNICKLYSQLYQKHGYCCILGQVE